MRLQKKTSAYNKKCRQNLHKGVSFANLLIDLRKVFDCTIHDFLIAKSKACSFSCET